MRWARAEVISGATSKKYEVKRGGQHQQSRKTLARAISPSWSKERSERFGVTTVTCGGKLECVRGAEQRERDWQGAGAGERVCAIEGGK